MSEEEKTISGSHPYLIGAAIMLLLIAVMIASAWFPVLSQKWVEGAIIAALLVFGILVSTYWQFLGSWRLWTVFATLVAFDATCVGLFRERLQKLGTKDFALIAGAELFVCISFLNWFLDTKAARLEMARRKQASN